EIGIRKVLGASAIGVMQMLTNDFLKPLLIAAVIAFPVAWWATNNWLDNFAYRIDLAWWMFALAAGIAFTIALLTICTQAVRAVSANPVDSLRDEENLKTWSITI